MKKTLLLILLSGITLISFSQNCILEMDSITAGHDATSYEKYYYDVQDRLVRVEQIDSGQTVYSSYDSLFYNVTSGNLESVYNMSVGSSTPNEITLFTYNGSNQIIKVEASGDNGNGPWTMTHDITYSGPNISNITLDPLSVTGNPEGMVGSFNNIVWSNGNVATVDLEVDFGGGMTTVEIIATYDNKNNIERLYPLTEAGDIILHYCTNNMLQLKLVNDEPGIGNAGDVALEHTYTYDGNNEVATLTEVPSIFESSNSVHLFTYLCSSNVENNDNDKLFNIYPNPTHNKLNISCLDEFNEIKIINISGDLVEQTIVNNNTISINTSDFQSGIYFIRIKSDNGIASYKFIKL